MKSLFQVTFLVLVAALYFLGLCWIRVGMYPEDGFGQFVSRWEVFGPLIAVSAPFIAFVAFTLGYDPRVRILKSLRKALLFIIQSDRGLKLSLGLLAILIIGTLIHLSLLIRTPRLESLRLLIEGDYDNAAALAEGEEATHSTARVIWLVSQAEIEAKRRVSTSDNQNEIAILRKELPEFDRDFCPLWQRFLANYGLGKLAFARKDVAEIEYRYNRSAQISKWIDESLAATSMRAMAEAFFSLSRKESNAEKAHKLVDRAEEILQRDPSIASQRLLGSIFFIDEDYGGAFRTWKAVLDRDAMAEGRMLELPNALERKRLRNNMALARLEQNQPQSALELVLEGLKETWDEKFESDRTEQVRLMATKVLCLIALDRPADAIKAFEERVQISEQLRTEGLTPGTLLLKANILSAAWKGIDGSDPERHVFAKKLLDCLILAQDPKRDLSFYKDHSRAAYSGLVKDVGSLWRWNGISFDAEGCEEAIMSLINQ